MSAVAFNPTLNTEISLSPTALEQLKKLTNSEDDILGVRLFISGGGCSGMTYGMTFIEEQTPFDCILEVDGLKLFVDSVALSFLEGVEIDYKTQGVNQNFVFKNVFASTGGAGTCGTCGAAGGC